MARLAIVILVIGIVELIQGFVGREAEIKDALVGGAGALYGVLTSSESNEPSQLRQALSKAGLTAISVVLLAPIAIEWAHVARIKLRPTQVANFEWPGAERLWQPQWGSNSHRPEVSIVRVGGSGASRVLKVQIVESGWSGVAIQLPLTSLQYRGIGFTVINPEDPFCLDLQLTFTDQSGRVTIVDQEIEVDAGKSRIQVNAPVLASAGSWGSLSSLLLFARQPAGSRTFFLDDVIRL